MKKKNIRNAAKRLGWRTTFFSEKTHDGVTRNIVVFANSSLYAIPIIYNELVDIPRQLADKAKNENQVRREVLNELSRAILR